MKKIHFESLRASRPKMAQPGIFPAHADFFSEWDSVKKVTFKDGRPGERYVLNKIPAELINFMVPGTGMGRITRTDVGRKLIVDVTNNRITSYIE
jgi:hypothetical protein